MADAIVAPTGTPALSQGERVIDTFVAPSKTFEDIRRSASWWLPFLITVLFSYGLMYGISKKVGWDQLGENTLHSNPKMEEKLSSLPPDQLALAKKRMAMGPMYGMAASPLFVGIMFAVFAGVLLATINFVFGGKATFGQVFAVISYASLVGCIKTILALILLFVSPSAAENFTMDQQVGTSPGYYISDPGALKTLLSGFDVFGIWVLVLVGIGLAIVARTKRSSGLIAVFAWWALILLIRTGFAAVAS